MLFPTGALFSQAFASVLIALTPAFAQAEVHFAASALQGPQSRIELATVDTNDDALPATPLRFSLDDYQPLSIEVLDLHGQRVRTLTSGLWAPGTHQLAWQRDNDAGERVPDGIYVIRLRVEAHELGLKPAR